MATIESLVFDFQAKTAEWSKGIEKVHGDLHKMSEGFGEFKAIAVEALAAIGIAMGFEALKGMVEHTLDNVTAQYRLSAALGMTQAQLAGIELAGREAGVSSESMTGAMQKFTKALGTAAATGGTVKDTLEALGLDTTELVNGDMGEAFTKVAGKIGELHNPIERARVLTELFGKKGQELAPLFAEGAEGIEEGIKKAKEFGLALSETDSAKLVIAHKAFETIGTKIEGLETQLVAGLAPALSYIADHIGSLIPTAETFRNAFSKSLTFVGDLIGGILDLWQYFRDGVFLVADAGVTAFGTLVTAIQKVAEGLVWVINKLGGHVEVPHWINEFKQATDALVKDMDNAFYSELDKPMPHEAFDEYIKGVNKGINDVANKMLETKAKMGGGAFGEVFTEDGKKVVSSLEKMKEEIDNFGLGAWEKQLAEIGEHGSAEQIKQANELNSIYQDLTDRAKGMKLNEEFASPLDKYKDGLKEIDELYKKGDITASTYMQKRAKETEEFEKKQFGDTTKRASAETRSFNFSVDTSQNASLDPLNNIRDYSKQMLDLERQQATRDQDNWRALQTLSTQGSLQTASF